MPNYKHAIQFGPKFCQKEFHSVLRQKNFQIHDSSFFGSHWELTMLPTTTEIIFDLTLNEWMGTEQIVFLFGWISNLKSLGKIVIVRLPYRFELSRIYSASFLASLKVEFAGHDGLAYFDSSIRMKRRTRCSIFLTTVFGMLDSLGLTMDDFENLPDNVTYNKQVVNLSKNNYQIIPFTSFDLGVYKGDIKYDRYFYDVIDANLDTPQVNNIFMLQIEMQLLLQKYACYSPFESKILSHIITQELFINSMQHSFEDNEGFGPLKECYISAFLSQKWEVNEDSNIFLEDDPKFKAFFLEEKSEECLDFYKDKTKITEEIKRILKKRTVKDSSSRFANLRNFDLFVNRSYLDYSFMDFGKGIPGSLKTEFDTHKQLTNFEDIKAQLSDGFWGASHDAQIIEYALLLDTSKFPLDKSIDNYELVPRGLFFLVDMVRRYKGLIIIHSGNGKIVYDFSDKIFVNNGEVKIKPVFRVKDAIKHVLDENIFFPGTLISITIPEKKTLEQETGKKESIAQRNRRKKDQTVISPLRSELDSLTDYAYQLTDKDFTLEDFPTERYAAERYRYISILILYHEVIDTLRLADEEMHVKVIYNKLFKRVNDVITAEKGNNIILLFDFAGLKSGNALWIKILYFLINTPKVNEQTKALIFNLPTYEDQMIQDLKENLINIDHQDGVIKKMPIPSPFLYKPIPCIKFRITADEKSLVDWIGLRDKADADLLTNLLIGGKGSYHINAFEQLENVTGNLNVQFQDKLYSTYSTFESINKVFFESQKKEVAKFLITCVEDGKVGTNEKDWNVYLSANGGYQFQYLSLYELLHDKYIARYFAKCLLNNYCNYVKSNFTPDHQPEDLSFSSIEKYRFSKILAVTISSQLIGVAIRDLIEEDDDYTFLRREGFEKGGPGSAPELIMLSSYYSFDTEKPFERVNEKDRILVVNDVIATGKLVEKIIRHVEKIKTGYISAVFSIADTRLPDRLLVDPNEVKSTFFNVDNLEKRFFTLASYKEGLILKKFDGPYEGDANKKRINPLLNTVVDLKLKHSQSEKVLIAKAEDFIKEGLLSTDYLKIGHFQQNLTHNGYITDMRSLFSKQNGESIIKQLKFNLEKSKQTPEQNFSESSVKLRLDSISSEIGEIARMIDSEKQHLFIELDEFVEKLKASVAINENSAELGDSKFKFRPDFIFYPVFSGMEKLSHFKLAQIFNIHPDNIIGLQRFDTPKGWRFPFPAKRFNRLTKNKSVLILDSGSLKGESLVQLIDNIGFLDVKEITVLSVICRIEDFNREFYSRLRSMKVKRLKAPVEKLSDNTGDIHFQHIIPISVYFGINLHIPVYSSSISCPFCEEIGKLKHTKELFKHALTKEVKEYIEKRLTELAPIGNVIDNLQNIGYLPAIRGTEVPETKAIFITRDKLGMIDSYRFYPEYFDSFKDVEEEASILNKTLKNSGYDHILKNWTVSENLQKQIELLLICLLHEPQLLELIENYLNGVVQLLRNYLVINFLNRSTTFEDPFYYKWSTYSLVRLYYLLDRQEIFDIKNFEKILSFNDRDANLFLHYQFWKILYQPEGNETDPTKLDLLLSTFHDNYYSNTTTDPIVYSDENREFPRILYNKVQILSLENYPYLDRPFNNISRFVYIGQSKGRHFELVNRLNLLYLAIENRVADINTIRDRARQVLDITSKELKPSITMIVNDPNIRKYFRPIYNIYADQEGGLLFYINILSFCYDKIRPIKQSELDDNRPILDKLSETCFTLINSILKQTEDQECFFKVSKQYPFNVTPVLSDFYQRNRKYFLENFVPDLPDQNISVACHKYIFESMLEEMITNAEQHYGEGFRITDFQFVVSENKVELFVNQDRCFKETSRVGKGGRSNLIEYFAQKFLGSYDDNAETSVKSSISNDSNPSVECGFELKLMLPRYILQEDYSAEIEEQSLTLSFK